MIFADASKNLLVRSTIISSYSFKEVSSYFEFFFFSVLEDETLVKLAQELGCTVAQVCLAWALAKGVAVVTKTENEQRMKENLLATQVKLSSSQIQAIDKLNKNQRLFWNPYEIQ